MTVSYQGPFHDEMAESRVGATAWEARPFGPSQIRAAFRSHAPLHSRREIMDEQPSNPKAPAPLPGEPFLVYRVGDSPSLTNSNGGNADSVARHLAGFDDFERPSGAHIGDSIMVFRVTADKFGTYEGLRRGAPAKGDGVGRAVRGSEVAYSFPEKGWTATLEDRIPVADVRNLLKMDGVRDGSFDEAGTNKGADAIREAFIRGARMRDEMRAQVSYMRARSIGMGLPEPWDVDTFLAQRPDDFNRLAKEWRDRQEARDRVQAAYAKVPTHEMGSFKKWFGDSKVVDDQGKPLVVYHGTGEDFSTFSDTSFEHSMGEPSALFFTGSRISGSGYAEERGTPGWGIFSKEDGTLIPADGDMEGRPHSRASEPRPNLPKQRLEWNTKYGQWGATPT